MNPILLFLRQTFALVRKDWIQFAGKPYANLWRCLVVPTMLGAFLAFMPDIFYQKPRENEPDTRIQFLLAIEFGGLGLLFFFAFVGIADHLPGDRAIERTSRLTEHMRAMGLSNLAHITSAHLSHSLAYLPAWVIISTLWQMKLFKAAPLPLFMGLHVILGLSIASYALILGLIPPLLTRAVSRIFRTKSPLEVSPSFSASVASIGVTFAAITGFQTGPTVEPTIPYIISVISCPPRFYLTALHNLVYNELKEDSNWSVSQELSKSLIAAGVTVLFYPLLAMVLETMLYDPQFSWSSLIPARFRRENEESPLLGDNVAISIRNLSKSFPGPVVAVEDISLDIPKGGIYMILGTNGAGKSTILSCIGGLLAPSSGTITYSSHNIIRGRTGLGIVPQDNVLLIPYLTCLQHLRVFSNIKLRDSSLNEDLVQLLKDCDLGAQIHQVATTLSGGQKRKLQLAIGIVGGSEVILADEVTAGVDPMSRRALWKILSALQETRTILFTTHLLDEVDYLADHVAFLAAPGKLIAEGPPVSLKRKLGEGYIIQVRYNEGQEDARMAATLLLSDVRSLAAGAYVTFPDPKTDTVAFSGALRAQYHLKTQDVAQVVKVLHLLEKEAKNAEFDVLAPSIEDVFLRLVNPSREEDLLNREETAGTTLKLDDGDLTRAGVFSQTLTIFYKRCLIARRNILPTLLSIIVPVLGVILVQKQLNAQVGNGGWAILVFPVLIIFPAFYAVYVAEERQSSVKIMQFSNGLAHPLGLWLGHFLFDLTCVMMTASLVIASITGLSDASTTTRENQLATLWGVLVSYGVAAVPLAYLVSHHAKSPISAFALSTLYNYTSTWMYYLSVGLLNFFYPKKASELKYIVDAVASIFTPLPAVAIICEDLFAPIPTKNWKPYLLIGYFYIYSAILLFILVQSDSWSKRSFSWLTKRWNFSWLQSQRLVVPDFPPGQDVIDEAHKVTNSNDILRVLGVSKSFVKGQRVVDDVSLGVAKDTLLALCGPNGAGKSTLFSVISGDFSPDSGEVLINGHSSITDPRAARRSLGVCPQFTAIDRQLTIRDHLHIYGRLKGLRGSTLTKNVGILLKVLRIEEYADRLASATSGGTQRKLALGIALVGNAPVILIDEFSSGIDPKSKRDLWTALRDIAPGKAIVITTHSMEEATALANKVAIVAKRMLAIGTKEALYDRYVGYEVHFTCRTREDVQKAMNLMSRVPGSKMVDDLASRFEVPAQTKSSLIELFRVLADQGEVEEFTVGKGTLESVYMKVIRQNKVEEENEV